MNGTCGSHRRGVILVIVIGIAAMLLSLAVVFLMRMRSDVQAVRVVTRVSQARLMLYAALSYIQETSRLGWRHPDPNPVTGVYEYCESFGWIDVRGSIDVDRDGVADVDGEGVPYHVGPRGFDRKRLYSDASSFPAPGGAAARCDMYTMVRPPWAVRGDYAPNALPEQDEYAGTVALKVPAGESTANVLRYARFSHPDPQPVASTWNDFRDGDTAPRSGSEGLSWFRVWRETDAERNGDGQPFYDTVKLGSPDPVQPAITRYLPSTFIVTVGAGATAGYRDFAEASSGTFKDAATFAVLRAEEIVQWFRVEWTPNVNPGMMLSNEREVANINAQHVLYHWPNTSMVQPPAGFSLGQNWSTAGVNAEMQSNKTMRSFARNFLGTIKWIQRLDREPPNW